MKTPRSDARFSLISCGTEESIASSSLATPLDLSPCVPPSSVMITVVASDTYPARAQLPMVVSGRQPRHHQDNGPHPHTALAPHQQRLDPFTTPHHRGSSLDHSSRRIWPRIKKMVVALGASLRATIDNNDGAVRNNETCHVFQHQLASPQVSPNPARTKRVFFPNNNNTNRVRPAPKD